MEQEIQLQDVKFPKGFKFEKTVNGFKVNTTGGEFFPNKKADILSLVIFLSCIFIMIFIYLLFEKASVIGLAGLIGFILMCISSIYILMSIYNSNIIETEYIFSPEEINIVSKKGKISIPKSDIKNIYMKTLIGGDEASYTYYSIFIDLKEPLNIPYTNKNKETINLFIDKKFFKEKIAIFLLQELDKIFDINDLDNHFDEIEKEKTIEYREIQLPKDLNYQKTANGFKVSSVGEGIFFSNKYKIPGIILNIIMGIALFSFFSFFEAIKNIHINLSHFPLIIKIIIFLIVVSTIPSIWIAYKLFIKNANPKVDYVFSPNEITISCQYGVLSIKREDIDNIYLENVVCRSEIETTTSYKIVLDFKNPIYLKSKKKPISTADILENFNDKKVCAFLVQEMTRTLKIT